MRRSSSNGESGKDSVKGVAAAAAVDQLYTRNSSTGTAAVAAVAARGSQGVLNVSGMHRSGCEECVTADTCNRDGTKIPKGFGASEGPGETLMSPLVMSSSEHKQLQQQQEDEE
jgi:hypothetical protein